LLVCDTATSMTALCGKLTRINVQGVCQWSCVKWYMKKLMMPPTTILARS
jgi:hypothetical protein